MTRKDNRPEADLTDAIQRRNSGRLYWLASAVAFLGGVLLQLLAAAASD
jgi:hypothetical protein